MKGYNQIQEKIEELEKTLIRFKSEIEQLGESPIAKNIQKQYDLIESDIKTLNWVLQNDTVETIGFPQNHYCELFDKGRKNKSCEKQCDLCAETAKQEQYLHDYNEWLVNVWNPNQLHIPFRIDAPRAFLKYQTLTKK